VVVGRNGLDLCLVPISSQLFNTEFPLADWRGAGLNVPCGIKAQIATVEEKLIIKVVGGLKPIDQKSLNERLRSWLVL
jgi:hypothetical protein